MHAGLQHEGAVGIERLLTNLVGVGDDAADREVGPAGTARADAEKLHLLGVDGGGDELGALAAAADEAASERVRRHTSETWRVAEGLPELPELAYSSDVVASVHDADTVFAVFENHKRGDFAPYVFKSTNAGKSWKSIASDLPERHLSWRIVQDHVKPGLLFVGTETGVYYSLDDGDNWVKLKMNLPAVPVVDMKIKDVDLVIGTNGRGFWILDDVTPLREMNSEMIQKPAHLYDIPDHTRFGYSWWMNYAPGGDPGGMKKYFVQNMRPGLTYYELGVVNGEKKRKFVDAGDPKPLGPMMYFRLSEGAKDVSISILDEEGNEIVTHSNDALTLKYAAEGDYAFDAGLNRFVWDMRYPLPSSIPGRPPTAIQPIAKPGTYSARLTVDGVSETREFELFINPGEPYTREQTDERFEFWMDLYNNVEASSQNVLVALKLKEEVMAKVSELVPAFVRANRLMEERHVELKAPSLRTRFNGAVDSSRVMDALVMDLADIKRIRKAVEGAKVNDVIVAIVGKLIQLRQQNRSWRRYRHHLISENKWRAVRYGIDGKLIDQIALVFGRSQHRDHVAIATPHVDNRGGQRRFREIMIDRLLEVVGRQFNQPLADHRVPAFAARRCPGGRRQ